MGYFMAKSAIVSRRNVWWKNYVITEALSPPTKIGSVNFKSAKSKKKIGSATRKLPHLRKVRKSNKLGKFSALRFVRFEELICGLPTFNNTTANKSMDLFIYFLCSNTPQGKLKIFYVNIFLICLPKTTLIEIWVTGHKFLLSANKNVTNTSVLRSIFCLKGYCHKMNKFFWSP